MNLSEIDFDTRTQEILLVASNHDLEALKQFLREPGSASVQDPETGFTPLHAAIAACGPAPLKTSNPSAGQNDSMPNGTTNGHSPTTKENKGTDEEGVDMGKAKATVRELFLSGAIWNDLDTNDETPGCLAWRLGQRDLYELVVEAGVRAELLMNLMGGYERLADEEEDKEEDDEREEYLVKMNDSTNPEEQQSTETPTNTTIAPQLSDPFHHPVLNVNSTSYLASPLTLTSTSLLDSATNGVMMKWETPIMSLTSSLLAPSYGLRILNIGFGMGIIDHHFASKSPHIHHIIEAHPTIMAQLSSTSALMPFSEFGPTWQAMNEGRNVVHKGRWQDVVPKLLEQGEVFDAIYFDTFGEDYGQLKMFFTEYVVGLLAPEGRFGFFNGLGADRRVCYDVYCRVVECDLADAGMDVEWIDVDVDLEGEGAGKGLGLGLEGEGEWKGVRRRYWTLEKYRLPICTFMG